MRWGVAHVAEDDTGGIPGVQFIEPHPDFILKAAETTICRRIKTLGYSVRV